MNTPFDWNLVRSFLAVLEHGSLLGAARERAPTLSPHLDGTSRLKVYVRDATDADAVAAQLEARLGTRVPWLMLHADVCRRELLVEIEGMHGVGA